MNLYECAHCGRRVEAKKWPYCSKGHKETGMYQIMRLGNQERTELLAEQNKEKYTPSK
jgi:endogenous inhibitor of DNA gyrase (YacG/DUF329 family)